MAREKVEFTNNDGIKLAGALELPEGTPHGYVLFAHCFTCGKDIGAASRIARELASNGYATLRFDFTGLGNSDGDFANTNFSSNVEDLLAAADFLRQHYQAPLMFNWPQPWWGCGPGSRKIGSGSQSDCHRWRTGCSGSCGS